jgi:acyl carrier protein
MGLDTVELVVAFEKHFQLDIPDPVAEQMGTVGDVAAWVGVQLNTTGQRHSTTRATVANKLQLLLVPGEMGEVAETRLLTDLLPDPQAYKRAARQLLGETGLRLLIPDFLPKPSDNNWLRKLLGGTGTALKAVPPPYRLSHLVDWTVANNYEKLLVPPLTGQYDVEQAVIGITADKSGVDIPDIHLGSSFTNELGMD